MILIFVAYKNGRPLEGINLKLPIIILYNKIFYNTINKTRAIYMSRKLTFRVNFLLNILQWMSISTHLVRTFSAKTEKVEIDSWICLLLVTCSERII